jgi:YihY family inner membrane protein
MAFGRLSVAIKRLRERIAAWGVYADRRLGGRPGILWAAIGSMLLPRTTLSAAAIAYFSILTIFPLTLLSIAIATGVLGARGNLGEVIGQLEFLAPMLGDLIGQNIAAILRSRGPVTALAAVALAWSASALFRGLGSILQSIWRAEFIRTPWQRNGIAVTLILLFAGPVLIIGLLLGSTAASVSNYFTETVQNVARDLLPLLAVAMDVGLFMVVYAVMPHGTATFRDLLPGAVAAGALWEVAKRLFASFVGAYLSRTNLVYGSVASIIAFLTWAYVSGLILLFGAYLSMHTHANRIRRQGPDLVVQQVVEP